MEREHIQFQTEEVTLGPSELSHASLTSISYAKLPRREQQAHHSIGSQAQPRCWYGENE